MKKVNYSIIVPVYKSKGSLKSLAEKVDELFSSTLKDRTYELIFVNDSPFCKGTCQALNELLRRYQNIKVIELTKNFGQQSAVLCGISNSSGEYIITMDDDMQHDPSDIPKLVEKQSHDIVIARFKKKNHSFFKIITSSMKGYFDCLILGKPRNIKLTSFRLFNRIVADNMLKIGTSYPFIPALLFSVSDDIVNVEVAHYAREEGRSNYTLDKMIMLFTNLIINNSSLLLKYIGSAGLVIAFLSFLYAGAILYRKIFLNIPIQGWSSIMVTVLFLGGVTIFTLGIIGEYLIRIIHTSERKPHYFIRTIQGKDE